MVQEVFDGKYLEDDGKVVLLCCRGCYSKYTKSIVKCAQPILSVCTNSNGPRWSGDGDEFKGVSSSLELLLHWISDEKNSSRYLGKEDTTENDTLFGGNDGNTKLVLCWEIRKYI